MTTEVYFKDDEKEKRKFDVSAKDVRVESDDGMVILYNKAGFESFLGAWRTKDIDRIEPIC